MSRKQPPWTEQEKAYLYWPIPAAYLSRGALRTRGVESIKWKRRDLGIILGSAHIWVFVSISPKRGGVRRRHELSYFPDTDWTLPIRTLAADTGLSWVTVNRLRRDAALKPFRDGRRSYSCSDFTDVDWVRWPTTDLIRVTGLCRTVVYRLRREFEQSLNGTPGFRHRD